METIKYPDDLEAYIANWKPRVKSKMTIQQFCEKYDFDNCTFSQWVNGHQMPTAANIINVESALKDLGV